MSYEFNKELKTWARGGTPRLRMHDQSSLHCRGLLKLTTAPAAKHRRGETGTQLVRQRHLFR